MKGQKYKHVTAHNQRFVFQLRVLGVPVYPGEHWDTEEDAACAADLTKHFLRENFFIDLPASLDPEAFTVMAYRLNVILSDFTSVLKALPPGVSTFLKNNRAALDDYAQANKPERKPWELLRRDPSFNSNPYIRAWVKACEGAEQNVTAFASINSEYLLTLLTGFVGRFEDSLAPLRKAVKMHAHSPDWCPRLEARKNTLTDLLAHLEADLVYIRSLPDSIREEEKEIMDAMHALENSRPAVY